MSSLASGVWKRKPPYRSMHERAAPSPYACSARERKGCGSFVLEKGSRRVPRACSREARKESWPRLLLALGRSFLSGWADIDEGRGIKQ
jgi:hypothetical protein